VSALTVGLVLYGAIALLALRPVTGHLAWKDAKLFKQARPDSGDWIWSTLKGAIVVGLWPVMLVLFACTTFANRALPKIGAEREAERQSREQRLRELERELELDH
jgi:hypothetical protein